MVIAEASGIIAYLYLIYEFKPSVTRPYLQISFCLSLLALVCFPMGVHGQVSGQNQIHDPSRILEEDGRYYTFFTGAGINAKFSDDLETWYNGPDIFASPPAWIDTVVPRDPQYENDYWAPSIIHYNNEYRVYYSASLFGSQTSAIGLVTNTTLNVNDPNYQWVDQGMVINSNSSGAYPYNAIDASVFVDNDSRMWMTWGSWWDGIFITELDASDGKPISNQPNLDAINIARNLPETSIEAPYIHYRDGYYYLFVNWYGCCSGVNSTYEIHVGRSTSPTGPFFDRGPSPTDMSAGGGTLFLGTEGDKIGPGHMGIYSENGNDYFGYHFYDGATGGTARYDIDQLIWTADGWPVPYSRILAADLNADTIVDIDDWIIFAAYHLADLSTYTPTEQALRGDLDGDGNNDFTDFRLFGDYYDIYQGAGAFAELFIIPEPSTAAMLIITLGATLRSK